MSLSREPVIKKFFTNKIESSRSNWYEYLIQIARTFYSIDGQEYRREVVMDKFSELSPRSSNADRDAANFRDEFGAYGSFLGIFRLEKENDRWFIRVSESAKNFLCRENSNAAAFLRAQLALFQYPNGMGAVVSDSGSVSVQGNVKTDTLRELNNNIRLNPLRLICKIIVALLEEKRVSISSIALSYPLLICMFNDDRLNQTYSPSSEVILQAYEEYTNPSFTLPREYADVMTNFKRNFHILEKTGLFVRDSRFGLMVSQSNYGVAYDCIKTISEIEDHFEAFDHLYGQVDDNEVRDIIAENRWGQYYDAGRLPAETLVGLGSEIHAAPIRDEYEETVEEDMVDVYKKAAQTLKEFVMEDGFEIPTTSDAIEKALEEFRTAYSPETLAALDDNSLLTSIFYSLGDNTNALCCWLEMNKECRSLFGSISGGSAYKFGLFQKRETGIWTTGGPQRPQELSEDEALALGKSIRDALVKGAQIIQEATLDSLEAYERLDDTLKAEVGSQYYNWGWVHKYFSLLCPDKLSGFHSSDWQMHVLRALRIKPSEKYYARSGQISMVQKHAEWYYRQFFDVFVERFGEPRQFVRIGTSDGQKNYAAEWAKRSVVGIGWPALGDLSEFVKGDGLDRKELQDRLKELYYPNDDRIASRKAGELARFYKCDNNTVFVIMDGEHLLALADNAGEYFFEGNSNMPHQRPATWRFVFAADAKMPEKSEGKLTSCYQLGNEDNLLYLYDQYFYGEDMGNNLVDTSSQDNAEAITEGSTIMVAPEIIENEKRFREWMSTQTSSAGTICTPSMISANSSALKKVCGMMDIVEYPDVNNLFAITDIDTFLDIKAIIRSHADFDVVNKACGNGFLKSALNWYEKFLNYILSSRQEAAIQVDEYDKDKFLDEVFMTSEEYDELVRLVLYKKNIILQGAPGVGKTFLAKRFAYSMLGKKCDANVEMVQFHQSYSYEDFIMGYKPNDDGFELRTGVFYNFCKKASKDPDPNSKYFFIVDEINRGNLSKIFGELMMLIESDKRGQKHGIKLAYRDEVFFVPENLYIIGMMNTADRSLAMMDYALRRRFSFYEVEPAFGKPKFKAYLEKYIHAAAVVDKVINRFKDLNTKIADEDNSGLGRGFCIGHSYFCVPPVAGQDDENWYTAIIKYEVAPLLDEYWWDDKAKAEDCIKDLLKD